MQYHIILSRINPSLKIDLARICTIKGGQAVALTHDEFVDTFGDGVFSQLCDILVSSDISDSMYVRHAEIVDIVDIVSAFSSITLDYFDNNFVIIFDYGTEKETPKEK